MTRRSKTRPVLALTIACLSIHHALAADESKLAATRITVTIDRGADVGQSFGSLFEARSADGSLVIGAGFQNAYNTRYRGDRHAVQFYIRPTDGERAVSTVELPRPNQTFTGSYLFSRDGAIYSTYGGVKTWDAKSER